MCSTCIHAPTLCSTNLVQFRAHWEKALELRALEQKLPDFRYVPALSEPDSADWDGETGLITDVVGRLEDDLSDVDAYLCGPPPMVDAAMDLLLGKGVAESHIYYDKFTTTEESEETSRT